MKAVIDLGTNTFHLVIGEQRDGQIHIVYKTNRPIKLGEAITVDNKIIPAAFERGINCLIDFRKKIEELGVNEVRAMATSAVRSAANGQEFIQQALEQANIHINIISGDEEAQYIYQGVKASGTIDGKSLIMDIGGGSTEFILCDDDGIFWKKSFDIGASRLMQRFFKSDPLSLENQNEIQQHLATQLPELLDKIEAYQPETLIGSAGAFENYAEMINPETNLNNISHCNINLDAYQKLAKKLLASTHAQREQMQDLIPLRVDMIVMATLQTNYILSKHNFQQLKLSTFDLKMGVLYGEFV